MSVFIGMEEITANALIELMERKREKEVSFDTLVKYGMHVVRVFKQRTGVEAILLLSREYQLSMLEDYSDFFEATFTSDGNGLFRLKNVGEDEDLRTKLSDLKSCFRWTMSRQMIDAFLSEEAIQELGIVA